MPITITPPAEGDVGWAATLADIFHDIEDALNAGGSVSLDGGDQGDLLVGDGGPGYSATPIGSTNQILSVVSGTAAWKSLTDALADEGIDFSGGTAGRVSVEHLDTTPAGAGNPLSFSPSTVLGTGELWLVYACGTADHGTVKLTYDGTTLTDNAASVGSKFVMNAVIVNDGGGTNATAFGWFQSDGGSTLERHSIATLSGVVSSDPGTDGSVDLLLVLRISYQTGGGGGGSSGTGSVGGALPSAWWDSSCIRNATGQSVGGLVSEVPTPGQPKSAVPLGQLAQLCLLPISSSNCVFRSNADSSGYPGWEFNGTSQVMNHSQTDSAAPLALGGLVGELWCVLRLPASPSYSSHQMLLSAIVDDASQSDYLFFSIGPTTGRLTIGFDSTVDAGATVEGSTTVGAGTHLARFVADGSDWRIWLDGVEETVSATSGSNDGKWFGAHTLTNGRHLSMGAQRYRNGGGLQIGSYFGAGAAAWIMEEIVHDGRLLSDDDALALQSALFAKWGI